MTVTFALLFLALSSRSGHHPAARIPSPASAAVGSTELRQVVRGASAVVVARPTMEPERLLSTGRTDSLLSAGFVIDEVLKGSAVRSGTRIGVVRPVPDPSPDHAPSPDPSNVHPFQAGVYILALARAEHGRWSPSGGTNGVLRFFASPDSSGRLLPDARPTLLQHALGGVKARYRDTVARIRTMSGKPGG